MLKTRGFSTFQAGVYSGQKTGFDEKEFPPFFYFCGFFPAFGGVSSEKKKKHSPGTYPMVFTTGFFPILGGPPVFFVGFTSTLGGGGGHSFI